jgi:SOS-response transcriptional repressor LexA
MTPALRDGDQLLVRMGGRPARVDDVVVVGLPDRPLAVKRLVRRHDGGVWVEGDNPFGSTDSRNLGLVPEHAVVGVVLFRLWPRPGRIPGPPPRGLEDL